MSAKLNKLNSKKLCLTILAVFAYTFITDFVIHGLLLESMYRSTATLWRAEQDMKAHEICLFLGKLILSVGMSVLFAKGYEGKGLKEGIRFGVLSSPVIIAPSFVQFAVMPIPSSLFLVSILLFFIQNLLAGIVAASVYRK